MAPRNRERERESVCERETERLRFYVLYNSILVLSGRCIGDNEKLSAMEPRLRSKRSTLQAGLESGTAR